LLLKLKTIKKEAKMKKLIAVISLSFLIGCVLTNFAVAEEKEVKIGEKVEFHKLTDKPIHLGDGKGNMDDIAPIVRDPNPPTDYVWKFNLSQIPNSGELTVSVYSVVPYFAWGCPTTVSLNGKTLTDLSQNPASGSGKTTTEKIPLKPENFRPGKNKLVIEENVCADGKSYNDSLVREVTLEVK